MLYTYITGLHYLEINLSTRKSHGVAKEQTWNYLEGNLSIQTFETSLKFLEKYIVLQITVLELQLHNFSTLLSLLCLLQLCKKLRRKFSVKFIFFEEDTKIWCNLPHGFDITKGQLILKTDWRAIDSPKKRTDEFVLFAFLLFTANKSNSSVHFLGESTARQSAFRFYLIFYAVSKFSGRLSQISLSFSKKLNFKNSSLCVRELFSLQKNVCVQ